MSDAKARNKTSSAVPRRRKRLWPRILLWSAAGLLVLILAAVCAGVLWLRSVTVAALPVLDGDLHLAGLSAPVIVRRDAHGVPHIEASSEDDLFMAQGYVTAQDRLWQMDAFRRNANGELAEIMGSSLVMHDKTQRVLQLRNTAQRIYANLPAEDRARLDAYARGVNLFIAQHQNSLPPEFKLLLYRPQPWSGVDSLSIGLMMVETLDLRVKTKLSRGVVSARLNNPKLEADLYPVGSWRDHPPTGEVVDWNQTHPAPTPSKDEDEDDLSQASSATTRHPERLLTQHPERPLPVKGTGFSPYINPAKSTRALAPEGNISRAPSLRLLSGARVGKQKLEYSREDAIDLRDLPGLPNCDGCAPGSNNWVVAGKHTASGKPLLSNDMHLSLTEPNIWYMTDLKATGANGTPSYHAAGVTLPGMPFVIAGHNEHVAWGFTALYADVMDLYIEDLDHKGNFQDNDAAWKPLKIDHEVIKVRGGKDVTLDVQLTAHGPLLNPLLEKEKRAIALKWTLYDPTLNTMPLYQLNVASNWTEFSAALATWSWPTQNVVYSDDQGHIAYHAIGKVPIRMVQMGVFDAPLPHDVMNGRLEWGVPVCREGSNRCNVFTEFQVYIPFDAMPHAFDPPSGFLATANSRVTVDKKSLYPFSGDASGIPLSDEWVDPYRIERIYKSLQGREQLKPADMLAVQTDIYSEVDQELGQRFAYAIDHTPGVDDRLKKAADLMRSWDGKLTTDSAAASIVTQTRSALWPMILEPKLGKEIAAEYHWSESNFAEEEIIMRAKADWLPFYYKNWDALLTDAVRKGMEQGKAPADVTQWSYGSWHVVDIEHPLAKFLPLIGRIAGTGEQPQSGDTTTVKQVGRDFGPSQRFTMDWSNVDGSTENIVLGESGNPLSPYFRDQWNAWYGGTTFVFPFTSSAVAAQTQHTLRLLP
jgi:penicillin amidase